MGQIVPEPVERYLAGLNRLSDPVLREIEREGEEQKLPLVDAEVGSLLRVLATAVGATRLATRESGSPARCRRMGCC
jgi:predicted O-methyltransferase YrrM